MPQAQSLYRSKNFKYAFITTQLSSKLKVQGLWDKANLDDYQEFQGAAHLFCRYDDSGFFKCVKRVIDSADKYTYEQHNQLLDLIYNLQIDCGQDLTLYELRFLIEEIVESYDKSCQTQTVSTLGLLSAILLRLGRNDEALSVWLTFIGLEPNSLIGYQKQAQLLVKLKREEQAISIWNLYLNNNQNDEFTYCKQKCTIINKYSQAQFLLLTLGKTEEAISVWDEYIQKNPNYLEAYECKANILHQMFELDRAGAAYDQYIQMHQNDFKGYKLKAEFLASLNQYDDAIEVWEKYLQIFPKDKKAYEKMGIYLIAIIVMIVNLKYQ